MWMLEELTSSSPTACVYKHTTVDVYDIEYEYVIHILND